jgi:hypothetical protein
MGEGRRKIGGRGRMERRKIRIGRREGGRRRADLLECRAQLLGQGVLLLGFEQWHQHVHDVVEQLALLHRAGRLLAQQVVGRAEQGEGAGEDARLRHSRLLDSIVFVGLGNRICNRKSYLQCEYV